MLKPAQPETQFWTLLPAMEGRETVTHWTLKEGVTALFTQALQAQGEHPSCTSKTMVVT